MDVWERVMGNTTIVVFLICVLMYVGIHAISQYWMAARMQKALLEHSDKFLKEATPPAPRGAGGVVKALPEVSSSSSSYFSAVPGRKVFVPGARATRATADYN
jgi:hypothetical protein